MRWTLVGVVLLLGACEPKPAPHREIALAQGILSTAWIYRPATPETLATTGLLEVEPGITADGPVRVLIGERGVRVSAVLQGPAAPGTMLEGRRVVEVLEARQASAAMVYRITDGNLCAGAQATHLVWYEPELVEGRSLTLAVVAGAAPGETGSTICRVLRYTRDREPTFEAAK